MHKYIENKFENYKFKHETNFYRKRIDFTYIDEKSKVHAIELKVKDWKNSLHQIEVNQLFANYSYLGIWHEYDTTVPKSVFKKLGFGLISINQQNCELLVKPRESHIVNENLSKKIKTQIIEGHY